MTGSKAMEDTTGPRSALITGAASGIGAAAARALAAQGVRRLLLLDVSADRLVRLRDELHGQHPGLQAEALVADVSDRAALRGLLGPRLRALGALQAVVNSAGVGMQNLPEDERTWHRVLDVNLHGAYHVTTLAMAWMGAGGRVVNVASVLGRVAHPRNTAYCAAKHALIGFTRGLALDLAPRGITVNAVLPASVDTPMYRRELALEAERAGMAAEEFHALAPKHVPIARFVQTAEVGALIAFLASPEAAMVTAQSCVIDGGQTWGVA